MKRINKTVQFIIDLYDYADIIAEQGYIKISNEMRNKIDPIVSELNKKELSVINEIKKFQQDRMLDKQNFMWSNEAVNILEELFEALGYEVPKDKRAILKEEFEEFVYNISNKLDFKQTEPIPEEMVDAFADIIVFSIGAIMKLGYEPECVLREVSKEINSRVGSIIDGKFQKDLSKKHLWYKANYKKCFKGKK